MALVEKAKRLLGTTETTETIHKALEQASRWVLLRQLMNQDFSRAREFPFPNTQRVI